MKKVRDTYTTDEKKIEDEKKPEKERTEKGKVVISNDAYAISEFLEQLTSSVLNQMRSTSR